MVVAGGRGRAPGHLLNPQGVAVGPAGELLVADSGAQCVQLYNAAGVGAARWTGGPPQHSRLRRPTGIAVLDPELVAVADYEARAVVLLDWEGRQRARLATSRLLGPKGLAVTQAGNLVVVDNKGCSVLVLDPVTGQLRNKFGARGVESGAGEQLAGPHYAAVTKTDRILVSDFHNHNVKVFTMEGKFIFSFGSHGEGSGQFNGPTGVAVDSEDRILVADWGNSRLQVYGRPYRR